jgi:hypothetical protein
MGRGLLQDVGIARTASEPAGNVDGARALIGYGVSLDSRAADGRTALHLSLLSGSPAAELLIAAGATIDVNSAAFLDDVERLLCLLESDPRGAHDGSTGLSPLGWARTGGARRAEELLLTHGARPESQQPSGRVDPPAHVHRPSTVTQDSRSYKAGPREGEARSSGRAAAGLWFRRGRRGDQSAFLGEYDERGRLLSSRVGGQLTRR